jgi:hypothetical protein
MANAGHANDHQAWQTGGRLDSGKPRPRRPLRSAVSLRARLPHLGSTWVPRIPQGGQWGSSALCWNWYFRVICGTAGRHPWDRRRLARCAAGAVPTPELQAAGDGTGRRCGMRSSTGAVTTARGFFVLLLSVQDILYGNWLENA